jgi:hypothetical protein
MRALSELVSTQRDSYIAGIEGLRGIAVMAVVLNHLGNGLCRIAACRIKEIVWFTDIQIVEKNLVQLVVVVLSSMYQHVLGMVLQFGEDATHLDQFRPRADDSHHLKHSIVPV